MSLTLFPLDTLELKGQKDFWETIRIDYPNAFDLFVAWSGWDGIVFTEQEHLFYYSTDVIRNLYDFFISTGLVLNPNPQFTMGGKVYYHPQILDLDTKKVQRFHQQIIGLKLTEQFLYIQGFILLNKKSNTLHEYRK